MLVKARKRLKKKKLKKSTTEKEFLVSLCKLEMVMRDAKILLSV